MANLFINSCVRKESRTLTITKSIIEKLNMPFEEIVLKNENLKPLTEKELKEREVLLKANDFSHHTFSLARKFAEAENIIIAAPYWDLGFPALLKIFIESICVPNITFKYTDKGVMGLCRAKKLIYVTTAGGQIIVDFGYSYIKALSKSLFGIKNTVCYKAENFDINNIQNDRVLKETTLIEFE